MGASTYSRDAGKALEVHVFRLIIAWILIAISRKGKSLEVARHEPCLNHGPPPRLLKNPTLSTVPLNTIRTRGRESHSTVRYNPSGLRVPTS